ncbi:hypothetical protein ACR3K2_27690 [Cryptosporidium serpentis]
MLIFNLIIFIYLANYALADVLLAPFNNFQGKIPLSLQDKELYIRFWEYYENEKNYNNKNVCLIIGNKLECNNKICNGIHYNNHMKVCNSSFGLEPILNISIPSFINKYDGTPRIFIIDKEQISLFNSIYKNLTICRCPIISNIDEISPAISRSSNGWKLEIIDETSNNLFIPKIGIENRFIVDTRVLINPGWNLEFTLEGSKKQGFTLYSLISLKKDPNCFGFPEYNSLYIITPIQRMDYINDDHLILLFKWEVKRFNDSNIFDYIFPVNSNSTTHYYLCYYKHYNNFVGQKIGTVYFRLDPIDSARSFSLVIFFIICLPIVFVGLFICINTKHKTNREQLQRLIIWKHREQIQNQLMILSLE